MSSPDRTALIFGCGYLGTRVAARWVAAGRRVAALTRRNADAMRAIGVEPITGDVLESASLTSLPAASTVLYAVGMDRSAGRTMRDVYVAGLGHVLDALPSSSRFIYVSSTSIYGQTDGGWVDEASATEPREESGRVILEAETLLRSKRPDAIVLRFAGIYGPNRLLRKGPLLAGQPLVGDAEKWLNLIHVDDGASAILAAETHGTPGETYNIADGEPVTRRAFYTELAQLLKAPQAAFEQRAEPESANRRIRRTQALEWSPRYPTYRDGLAMAVRETKP